MAKKAAKNREAKAMPSTPKAKKTTEPQTTEVKQAVEMVAALVVATPVKTYQFSHLQITITLAGKDAIPRCDILASKDDESTSYQSGGFKNSKKALLLEVLEKLSTGFWSLDYLTLGIDDQGGLVPTGIS